MTIILIIVAVLAAAYAFAAVAFYYGFKNWYPMCGGSASCRPGKPCEDTTAGPSVRK